jgi:hypothetical protein
MMKLSSKLPVADIATLALNFDLIKLNSSEVHQDGEIDSEMTACTWGVAQLIVEGRARPIRGTSYKSSRIIALPRFRNEMAVELLGVS